MGDLPARVTGAFDLARGVGQLDDRAHRPCGHEQARDQRRDRATEDAEQQEDLDLGDRVVDVGQRQRVQQRRLLPGGLGLQLLDDDAVPVLGECSAQAERVGLELRRLQRGLRAPECVLGAEQLAVRGVEDPDLGVLGAREIIEVDLGSVAIEQQPVGAVAQLAVELAVELGDVGALLV